VEDYGIDTTHCAILSSLLKNSACRQLKWLCYPAELFIVFDEAVLLCQRPSIPTTKTGQVAYQEFQPGAGSNSFFPSFLFPPLFCSFHSHSFHSSPICFLIFFRPTSKNPVRDIGRPFFITLMGAVASNTPSITPSSQKATKPSFCFFYIHFVL